MDTTNYKNGKIYKIEPTCEHDEGDIYIGSTTKRLLSHRMASHRCEYKKWKNGLYHKLTSFDIFDKYGVDNVKIVLIELVNANSRNELMSREAFYIKNNKCVNKIIPNRTIKEWQNDNKDKMKEYQKSYREKLKLKKVIEKNVI